MVVGSYQMSIVHSSNHWIAGTIDSPAGTPCWQIICIYSPNRPTERRKMWEEIAELLSSGNIPTMLLGDMNTIVYQGDKMGGVPVNSYQVKDIQQFIQRTSLIDLRFQGPAFTWTNRRSQSFHIIERLDRAFAEVHWVSMFPNAAVFHLPRIASDHNPILVNLCSNSCRRNSPFKFESK